MHRAHRRGSILRALRVCVAGLVSFCAASHAGAAETTVLYETDFGGTPLGQAPTGWVDLVDYRPSRNWAVDGKGFLRVMLKEYVGDQQDGDRARRREYLEKYGVKHFRGIIAYEGALADGSDFRELRDVRALARFKKTSDSAVTFGLALRIKDADTFYEARVSEANRLTLLKRIAGVETELAAEVSRERLPEGVVWGLEFSIRGDTLTARLLDGTGREQARIDAKDGEIAQGMAGLTATTFSAAAAFSLQATEPFTPRLTEAQVAAQDASRVAPGYPVVAAEGNSPRLDTPFSKIAKDYDLVVAGAGTGGVAAALQAARMGARVLLIEETDWIGGQMGNAAVTSMDDGGIWGKNPDRERGIYREFHESAINHYYTIDKDPFTAYHFNLQSEGGYEPRVARGVLYGLIEETRRRVLPDGKHPVLDVVPRTRVSAVRKSGEAVNGVTLEEWTESGVQRKDVGCKILVDATEYGDVIPLTGARYRLGATISDQIDPATRVQDHTWVGVIREYPDGLPEELRIKEPPPGYERIAKVFRNYQLYGTAAWGGENRGVKGPRLWWVYAAWRGMPDSGSPATGVMTEERHTKCGLNGGNDYAVTAAAIEDPAQRAANELAGINATLGIIYWFQNELGLPWGPAGEEGYATPYNLHRMEQRGVRGDLLPIAARLPQWPYVREARRIVGVETLRGQDLYTRDRGDEAARHWDSAVAINDYSFDLHGTEDQLEPGLDERDYINATGPFPVPFGVFIPERVDGFLPAEKNFSQSRLANGATRLQPSTMLTGQAVGAIGALAARQGIPPRNLNIIGVQSALLESGDTLVSRWYEDVPYASPIWKATQLLTLYGMMDRPGPLVKDRPLGEGSLWGAGEALSPEERAAVLSQLGKVVSPGALPGRLGGEFASRAEFALAAADLLRREGRYFLGQQEPYAPPHDLEKARKIADKRKSKSQKKSEQP